MYQRGEVSAGFFRGSPGRRRARAIYQRAGTSAGFPAGGAGPIPAREELEDLPESVVLRVLARIEALATEPRPRGCCKLAGSESLWRIRVGNYRVLYAIDDPERLVDIIAVRHRKDAYR